MSGFARARLRLGYAKSSWLLLGAGVFALAAADLRIGALQPQAEMLRLLGGLLKPDVFAIEGMALVHSIAFAVLGVGLGGTAGLLLSLVFAKSRGVRTLCAFLRSIHELFWALLLMHITGLSPLTGVLAIALPYAGIFAKVYAEMIEEADLAASHALPAGASRVSVFAFAQLPPLLKPFSDYALYRFECGLRSTLVLGFIGLPTIGFNLDSFFKQGRYAQAAALLFCFYALIATRRLWARPATLPLLLIASLFWLPAGPGGGSPTANLARFFGHDIVPFPLRGADLASVEVWVNTGHWFWRILTQQILPGAAQTLIVSQIALAGMALLSLMLFPLVSRRFAGRIGRPLGRAALVIARSTPEYMLAYVLLQTLGPSMLPAIIALTLHNGAIVGYLLGRHADALEYRADAPRRRLDLYFFEVLPRLYGQFLAYVLYRWEIILRESAIFGILGVTTLGFYVDGAIAELKLDVALALVLATAYLSISVDALSRRLRATLRIGELPVRLSAERAIFPMQSEAASSLGSAWRSSRATGVKPDNEPH